MSITDELRACIKKWGHFLGSDDGKAELLTIADRIDEKHYDVQADAYDNGANYVFDNPKLFGLMQLPKDADGQYIHIGDMMECDKLPNGNRVCGEVKAISNDCVWLTNVQYKIHAKYLHHYHEPTVEDVLREFAGTLASAENNWGSDVNNAIAEYAAKLQLKERE